MWPTASILQRYGVLPFCCATVSPTVAARKTTGFATMPEMAAILRAQRLSKFYQSGRDQLTVFANIDLEVRRGERLALTGESGAGKSTLLHLLGGLDFPSAGRILYEDQDISSLNEFRLAEYRNRHVGFVWQIHHLLPEFTALENVMMPMRKLGKLSPLQMAERAGQLLSSVGLGSKLHRLGTHLSGGEQQRVAIARALANQPSVILADEPTGNLDVSNATIVFDLLTRLAKENGQAVILVTHNPDIASRCDVTRPMRDGLFV